MDCGRVDELVDAYLAGELSGAARAGLEEHLAVCARCRQELERARRARIALASIRLPDPPRGQARRLRRRIIGLFLAASVLGGSIMGLIVGGVLFLLVRDPALRESIPRAALLGVGALLAAVGLADVVYPHYLELRRLRRAWKE